MKKTGAMNWIKGAIKHPGAEKKAAAAAGESTRQYMEEHKNDPGTAGRRARLGLALEGFAKKRHPHANLGRYLHPKKVKVGIVESAIEGSPAEEKGESKSFEKKEDAGKGEERGESPTFEKKEDAGKGY